MRSPPPPSSRSAILPAVLAGVLLLLIVIAAVVLFGGLNQPGTAPIPTAVIGTQTIAIDVPVSGATVNSPFELRGRVAAVPAGSVLNYRVLDANGAQVGAGTLPVAGEVGQPGAFAALASFSAPAGTGRIEITDPGAAGPPAVVAVNLAGVGGPLPTLDPTVPPIVPTADPAQPTVAPLPPTATIAPQETAIPAQQIIFDSPPPGVEVGSPMTITGRTTRFPFQGRLGFRVVDAGNRQLGVGAFPVSGSPGQSATFVASISFSLPSSGGPVRVELFDQNADNGVVVAASSLNVQIAVPQQIVIESPAGNTQVGSPVTITGRTARAPFQGNLAYTISGPGGVRLGEGIVPVSGNRFVASLGFALPAGGGTIRAEFVDQDARTGAVVARTGVDMIVAAPTQAITIDSPPSGAFVGSPMTITGRTVLYPTEGDLVWRVRDTRGVALGTGSFPVGGQPNQPATFVASITFILPAAGGPVTLDLIDQGANGAVIASASLPLNISPQNLPTAIVPTRPPATAIPSTPTSVPPVATLPVVPSDGQTIIIETPPEGVLVGSPMTITGRTNRPPRGGVLNYRIATTTNQQLGEGQLAMLTTDPNRFNVALTFQLPQAGGPITIELFERDSGGAPIARATLRLNIAPQQDVAPRTSP
jgi:hypothetical protein